ncbi:vesicle-associated membrane protein 8 [Lingula anatina]|uniref:Vesicle-associated membrane protein 8 n=1 Tax=Lingula anatina TaxID=7574 RepID=A0A1S3IKJ6_LINAN|nr:vesicle-associated membrane protein 8 [Lingula anatina]|eukprot:XP_013398044.1 vesicle-associated membrane protein 8 [Lingula anatina]
MADKPDKLGRLQKDVNEVTHLLQDNINKVLVRGEKLDALEERTEHLHDETANFKTTAAKTKRKYCLKNARMCMALIITAVVVVLIIVIVVVVLVATSHTENAGSTTKATTVSTPAYIH